MSELFLGVDGGGTKTAFTLIDRTGAVVAQHLGGSSYYPQIGIEGLTTMLRDGVARVCAEPDRVRHAFFGLPAFGEDSRVDPILAELPRAILGHDRFHCGNDMICGWAGSLGGRDGINIVAGTGSIGYGERAGRGARAGGWGELFSDEGSAYWIAVEGLRLFSRMSDGRAVPGLLLDVLRSHFDLGADLDLCGRINGAACSRDTLAALCPLIRQAAEEGDLAARAIFVAAAGQLADIVHAIGRELGFDAATSAPVSYSGGVFGVGELVLGPFRESLAARSRAYMLVEPANDPRIGAALYAMAKADAHR